MTCFARTDCLSACRTRDLAGTRRPRRAPRVEQDRGLLGRRADVDFDKVADVVLRGGGTLSVYHGHLGCEAETEADGHTWFCMGTSKDSEREAFGQTRPTRSPVYEPEPGRRRPRPGPPGRAPPAPRAAAAGSTVAVFCLPPLCHASSASTTVPRTRATPPLAVAVSRASRVTPGPPWAAVTGRPPRRWRPRACPRPRRSRRPDRLRRRGPPAPGGVARATGGERGGAPPGRRAARSARPGDRVARGPGRGWPTPPALRRRHQGTLRGRWLRRVGPASHRGRRGRGGYVRVLVDQGERGAGDGPSATPSRRRRPGQRRSCPRPGRPPPGRHVPRWRRRPERLAPTASLHRAERVPARPPRGTPAEAPPTGRRQNGPNQVSGQRRPAPSVCQVADPPPAESVRYPTSVAVTPASVRAQAGASHDPAPGRRGSQ